MRRTAFLHHPSTVTVYDYGRSADGRRYYAMELVDGHDLATLVLRMGPLDPGRVGAILRDVAGALAEAHGQGLVHRDIKPANLMLCREVGRRSNGGERAKVLDFGLVREPTDPYAATTTDDEQLVTGTPHYLAPEAIRNPADLDGRADLYSLGATAYFLLTGRHVFAAGNTLSVCLAHLREPVAPPSHFATVPPALEAIVLRLLAKERTERFPNASALQEALEALTLAPPTSEESAAWWESLELATLAA